MHSCAFEYSVRNGDLYDGVGGFSRTNADFIMFYQYLNNEDYVAYVQYGPEIEPSEDRQGEFLEELSETLKSYLPKNCVTLRYDLNWESHWCKPEDFDVNGKWPGLPRSEYQEIKHVGIDMNLPDSGRRYRKIVVLLFGVSVFFLFLCLKHCYEYT